MALIQNVERRMRSSGTFLDDEPRFVLLQELHDLRRSFSVIEAIATVRTRLNEIAQGSGVALTSVPF